MYIYSYLTIKYWRIYKLTFFDSFLEKIETRVENYFAGQYGLILLNINELWPRQSTNNNQSLVKLPVPQLNDQKQPIHY